MAAPPASLAFPFKRTGLTGGLVGVLAGSLTSRVCTWYERLALTATLHDTPSAAPSSHSAAMLQAVMAAYSHGVSFRTLVGTPSWLQRYHQTIDRLRSRHIARVFRPPAARANSTDTAAAMRQAFVSACARGAVFSIEDLLWLSDVDEALLRLLTSLPELTVATVASIQSAPPPTSSPEYLASRARFRQRRQDFEGWDMIEAPPFVEGFSLAFMRSRPLPSHRPDPSTGVLPNSAPVVLDHNTETLVALLETGLDTPLACARGPMVSRNWPRWCSSILLSTPGLSWERVDAVLTRLIRTTAKADPYALTSQSEADLFPYAYAQSRAAGWILETQLMCYNEGYLPTCISSATPAHALTVLWAWDFCRAASGSEEKMQELTEKVALAMATLTQDAPRVLDMLPEALLVDLTMLGNSQTRTCAWLALGGNPS